MPDRGLGGRLTGNFRLQGLSRIVAIVISVITVGVLARRLNVEAFGGYNFLFTFMFFFVAFNDLGIPLTVLREITEVPARTAEWVQNMIGLRLVMAFASIAVGWSVVVWLDLPPAYRVAQFVYLLILPVQAMGASVVVLQSRIQIGRVVAADIIMRVVGFAVMLAAIFYGQGLLWVGVALVRRAGCPAARFDLRVWARCVGTGLPLSGNSVLTAILNRVDMVMLQKMAPTAELGLARVAHYGSAYRVPNLVERVPILMMSTVFPMMVSLATTDVAALRRLYWKTLLLLSAIALPMVAVVTVAAPYVVEAWMGPDYAPVVPLMRALVWASAFLYVALTPANLLIALRRQRINFWIMIPAAALNIGLNLYLIPTHGALGAAWANVASYGFLAAGYLIAVAMVMPAPREEPA